MGSVLLERSTVSARAQEGRKAPPSGITGGLSTKATRPTENRVLVDWVEYTLPLVAEAPSLSTSVEADGSLSRTYAESAQGTGSAVPAALSVGRIAAHVEGKRLLGDAVEWSSMPHGFYGYDCMIVCGHVQIMWHSTRLEMGLHVQASGKGCREIEAAFDPNLPKGKEWPYTLMSIVLRGATVTRLDLALDDVAGMLMMDEIEHATRERWVVTRYRKAFLTEELDLREDGGRIGRGIRFGRRGNGSSVMVYDKALEQGVEGHWVRVEARWEKENANLIIKDLAQDGMIAATNHLLRVLDFKVPSSDTNRSRWVTVGWWSRFLQWAEKAQIARAGVVKTIKQELSWLVQQVSRKLAKIATCHPDYVPYLLALGFDKLKEQDHVQIEAFHRDLFELGRQGAPGCYHAFIGYRQPERKRFLREKFKGAKMKAVPYMG